MFEALTDAELAELIRTLFRGYLRARNVAESRSTDAAWLPLAKVMSDCHDALSDASAEQSDRILATDGSELVAYQA